MIYFARDPSGSKSPVNGGCGAFDGAGVVCKPILEVEPG